MTVGGDEYITKRQLIVTGAIVGLALTATITGLILIAISVNEIQQREIMNNASQLRRQLRTDRQLKAAIRDLQEITHPTPAQYRLQVREGIRRCFREPSCRRLFPKLARTARAEDQRSSPSKSGLARSPGSASTPLRTPQSGGRSPSSPTRPARPQRRLPARTPASPPNGTSSGPPASPRPAVDLHAPLPVAVCADELLGINC